MSLVEPLVNLNAHLASLGSGPVYFRPNPGNGGDALIALATFECFRTLGTAIRPVGAAFDPTGRIVVYGGGGSLVPPYRDGWAFLARVHSRARRLIVLPQSIRGNHERLARLGPNVDLICREAASLGHARRYAPRANVLLGEDMALQLDVDRIRRRPVAPALRALVGGLCARIGGARAATAWPSPRRLLRGGREEALQRVRRYLRGRQAGVLSAFRTDCESMGVPVPAGNVDLSVRINYGHRTPALALLTTRKLLDLLGLVDEVHTDRLHIAIAAALLGKRVELFANSYFKCEAVYWQSLRRRFPNVSWQGARRPAGTTGEPRAESPGGVSAAAAPCG